MLNFYRHTNKLRKMEKSDIHIAVLNRDYESVSAICNTPNVDIDERESEDKTGLYVAAEKGYDELVELFLKKDATVDARNNLGYTPLHIATEADNYSCVCLLIKYAADVNARESEFGSTPLIMACFWGHFDIAQVLLNSGADPSVMAYFDHSPLGCATVKGHLELVKLLLDHGKGVDIESKTNNGYTPLMHAVGNNNLDVVDLLLTNNANINVVDNDGKGIAHILAAKGNVTLFKKLVIHKLKVSFQDDNGDSPLHMAVGNNHLDMVKALVQSRVDFNLQNKKGYSVLHTAAEKGYQQIARYLQSIGVDASLKTKDGDTATDLAYCCNHAYISEILKLTCPISPEIKERKKEYEKGADFRSQIPEIGRTRSNNAPTPAPRTVHKPRSNSENKSSNDPTSPTAAARRDSKVNPQAAPRKSFQQESSKNKDSRYMEIGDGQAVLEDYLTPDTGQHRIVPVEENTWVGAQSDNSMGQAMYGDTPTEVKLPSNTLQHKESTKSDDYKKTKNIFRYFFRKKQNEKASQVSANRSRKTSTTDAAASLPPELQNLHIAPQLKSMVSCVFVQFDKLVLGNLIGRGNFGRVYDGSLQNETGFEKVAVKTTKYRPDEIDEIESFLKEGLIMKDFKHAHVLGLRGVTFDLEGNPLVILPLMTLGNLRGYIRNTKQQFTVQELLKFGLQVGRGMEYLSKQKFVHRDLACRNCMIDKPDEGQDTVIVKVADFGLSRELFKNEYYTIANRSLPLPVRWMAPESLEKNIFKLKSDVWSYGVLLWELLTRGSTPYANIENWDIEAHIAKGNRLEKPRFCPNVIYGIMQACWNMIPDKRPEFTVIVREIEEYIFKDSSDAAKDDNLPEEKLMYYV